MTKLLKRGQQYGMDMEKLYAGVWCACMRVCARVRMKNLDEIHHAPIGCNMI